MNRAIAYAGGLISLGFLTASAAANFLFGQSLGQSYNESLFYGSVGILAVGFNAFAPFYLSWSLQARQRTKAAGIGLLWSLCLLYSVTSALGFAAQNREHIAAARQLTREGYDDIRRELLDLENRQPKKGERAILQKHIDETRKKLEALREKGAPPPDAQSAFISFLTYGLIPPKHIRISLVALFALLIECGATIGLFVSLSHSFDKLAVQNIPAIPGKWKPKT